MNKRRRFKAKRRRLRRWRMFSHWQCGPGCDHYDYLEWCRSNNATPSWYYDR